MALPKKNRLSKKKEIDQVFKNGKTVRGSFLFIRFINNEKGYSRFSFIVPSKYLSLAADRNKAKRIMSAESFNNLRLLRHNYDIAVVINKKVNRGELKVSLGELKECLSKL